VSPDGAELPAFEAGAHVEVRIGDFIRQYSLFNSQSERRRYRIAVKREALGRGGSARLCDTVECGDRLPVRGPRHAFGLGSHAQKRLLIAGGIGITPILSMADQLWRSGADFQLHYLARSRGAAAFASSVEQFGGRAHVHFDDGPEDQRADLAAIVGAQALGTQVYVCGPGGMIDAVVATAVAAGIPLSDVHFERFAAAASAEDRDFEIVVRSTAQRVHVGAGTTAVQALAAQAGIHVPVSCEAGVCGTCVVRLVEGHADHRDLVLSDEERTRHSHFAPCCSRAISPVLVLDL
jgi:vanillate O-demethylase ferredoxin subunit